MRDRFASVFGSERGHGKQDQPMSAPARPRESVFMQVTRPYGRVRPSGTLLLPPRSVRPLLDRLVELSGLGHHDWRVHDGRQRLVPITDGDGFDRVVVETDTLRETVKLTKRDLMDLSYDPVRLLRELTDELLPVMAEKLQQKCRDPLRGFVAPVLVLCDDVELMSGEGEEDPFGDTVFLQLRVRYGAGDAQPSA